MFSSKHSQTDVHSYALFDISASTVGVCLGHAGGGGSRQVLWEKRIAYAYGHDNDYEHYLKGMYTALLEAGMAMQSEGIRVAQRDPSFHSKDIRVRCFYAPPWYYAKVTTQTQKFPKRQSITHSILDEMRGSMVSQLLASPQYESWQTVTGTGDLLEQYDVQLLLDGYSISEKKAYEASEATLATYLVVAARPVVTKTSEIIRRVFANQTLRTHTTTRAFALLACEKKPAQMCLSVEIGGPVTSVGYIKDGILSGIATFPIGTHHIMKAVAPDAQTIEQAERACDIFQNNTEFSIDSLPQSVLTICDAWHEGLAHTIQVAGTGVAPPQDIYIATPPQWSKLFSSLLQRPYTYAGVATKRTLTPHTLLSGEQHTKEGDETIPLGHKGDARLVTLLHTTNLLDTTV